MIFFAVSELHSQTLDLGGLALRLSLLGCLGKLVLISERCICLGCLVLSLLSLGEECGEVLLRHLKDGDDSRGSVAFGSTEGRLLGLQVGLALHLEEGSFVKVLQDLNGLGDGLC